MRKIQAILLLVLISTLFLNAKAEFLLPESLTVIEEGAFQGTVAETVVIPDTVKFIGDFAFADIPSLQRIVIPASVVSIADHVFDGSEHVIVYGAPGAYAELWAERHGVTFAALATAASALERVLSVLLGSVVFVPVLLLLRYHEKQYLFVNLAIKGERRRAELYPLMYDFP